MERYTTEGMRRLNHLMSETDAAYHEAALKLDMSDSIMQILYTLCDRGGECALREIRELSGVSKQTINSALRKLEDEGIVYLEGMDGKRKRVCLTEQGTKLAQRTVVKVMEIENSILDAWPQEHVEQYLELTRKYLEAFREKTREL